MGMPKTDTPNFKPLTGRQREELLSALRGNVNWGHAVLTDRRDTSFAGASTDGNVTDDEVICAALHCNGSTGGDCLATDRISFYADPFSCRRRA